MAESNLVNPYERIWQTRDLRALEEPIELESTLPEWRKGIGAFGKEMQATGYGIAALGAQGLENIIGENKVTKGITDWGLEGYKESMEASQTGYNAPKIARIEDIKTASDATDWASYQLGKGLPMLASLAASGGIGGAVARLSAKEGVKQLAKSAVGDVVKKGVATKALQAAEGQVVTKAMQEAAAKAIRDRMVAGAVTGGVAGSFGLEGGQQFGEAVGEGVAPADAVKSAIAVGGINAALEFLPFYHVAKKAGLGEYAKRSIADIIANDAGLAKKAVTLAVAKEVGGRAAKGGAEAAAIEGITEGLQELTNIAGTRWAKEDPLFAALTDDDWSRIKNAMAAGAVVGGIAAGAGAPFAGPEVQQKAPTPPPPIQTKVQVLEEMQKKIDEDIKTAENSGDVTKVEQLQKARKLYDAALNQIAERAAPPTQEAALPPQEIAPPAQEIAPVQELATPTQEAVPPTQETTVAPPVQAAPPRPSVEAKLPTIQSPLDQIIKQEETKLAQLAQQKDAVVTDIDKQEIDQAIKRQEDLLTQLSQQKEATVSDIDKQQIDQVIADQEALLAQSAGQAPIPAPAPGNAAAISTAVQNGKAPDKVTKLVSAFDLDVTGSQWNMENKPDGTVHVTSTKESANSPQWNLVWNDADDTIILNQKINGVDINDVILTDVGPASKPITDTWQVVNPWIISELIADVALMEDHAALENKWGADVAAAAMQGDSLQDVINALANSHLYDLATGKITSPYGGTLELAIQAGLPISEELGGNVAKGLVDNGFAPNTVEDAVKNAPPGWKLTNIESVDPYFAWDQLKITYEKGPSVIEIEGDIFGLYPNGKGGNVTYYDSYAGLLEGINQAPQQDNAANLPAPPPGFTLQEFNNNVASYTNDAGLKFYYEADTNKWQMLDPADNTFMSFYSYPAFLYFLNAQLANTQQGGVWPNGPDLPSFEQIKDYVKQNAPVVNGAQDLTQSMKDDFLKTAPLGYTDIAGTIINDGIAFDFLVQFSNGAGSYLTISSFNPEKFTIFDTQGNTVEYDTFQEALNALASGLSPADLNTTGPATQTSYTPAIPVGSWAPDTLPGGYESDGYNLRTPEGLELPVYNLSASEITDIAHIHNYLKHAQIPLAEKIQMFKNLPRNSTDLAQFKANHPYLLRKVSIDEANTVAHARTLLNDILVRRDKYTFDEILQQSIKFSEKFGSDEFVAALTAAPAEQFSPPQLDGWLSNMRAEEDLLKENPFDGIWADYDVNKGPNAEAARYGVIVINPKTGKVLLRKVSNQYEGITWDFARGGAERFGSPDAAPNLIDTNAAGIHQAPANKRYMEHPLIAAKREAKEEFGYDVTVIGQLAKGFYTANNNYEANMASLYYIAVPTSEQTNEHLNPTHGIKETDETRWVDIHEARQLIMTEPTLGIDHGMKRDGKHLPRLARIARTLEAVFDPSMQLSDLDYSGSAKAMEKYFYNGLRYEFPNLLSTAALNGGFNNLTELQKLNVSAALYISKRFPNADSKTKEKLRKELAEKRIAAMRKWLKDRVGSNKITDIVPGNASISTIENKKAQLGGKIVLSLWHGSSKTREAMLGDVINPIYLGWGWGGHDTKNGMYFTDSKDKAEQWGRKRQHNILVAFENLKVITGTTQYNTVNFENIIKDAKNNGYDGVLFEDVDDTIKGRQVVAWNAENMTAAGGLGVGFTGKNLYQNRGELKEGMDVDTAKVILGDTFGPLAQKMMDSGFLELVEGGGPDGVAGQYLGDEQKIRIYMDYISSPRELIGAMLHEGSHAGIREMLGKSTEAYYKELMDNKGEEVKSAMYKTAWEGAQRYGIENALTPENESEIERVRTELKKIDPDFLIEEDLANFVQQADPTLPLWRKIFNAIKAWWAQSAIGKALKERGFGFELTPEMAAGLVTAALRTQSLRRGADYSTYVAHVSGNDWNSSKKYPYGRPLLKYILASGGEGFINYGWGFYVSESVPTHDYYKSTINQGTSVKTYGLHLPDDIPPRMIEWDRELSQQSSIVKSAITSSKNNYLLLRMAVKSKDRKSSYPGDNYFDLEEKGTGGALYNQLRDHFIKTKYNGQYGFVYDPETGKDQSRKNLARRDASRLLADYGVAGVRLLDAGSRRITVTRLANNRYSLSRGTANPQVQEFSEDEFIKTVGPDLAAKVKTYPVGVSKKHAGFGYYNWVFWRQSDLDRFTVVYKNGNQVAPKPKANAAYDPNGIGIPYPENPGFSDYVIHPKTGEKAPSLSMAGQTIGIDVADIRSNIDSVMGDGWLAKAEQAGLVEVVDGVGPNNESGSWVGDKIRLYAGSMPLGGSPIGVLLHEGKHATFKEVLGKALNDYASDLRTLADNGNQAARDAIVHATVAAAEILGIKHGLYEGGTRTDFDAVRAAIEERQPGLLAEEELAYFVQYGTETQSGVGFLRRLINQIKAWFAQTKLGQRLKEMGVGFEMTEGMAVEWAKMGLHRSLAQLRQTEQAKAQTLFQAAYMAPSARLGRAMETLNSADEFYSMGIQEIKQQLWTDPTDARQELVNKPGLLQRLRADFVDFFAEMEKKSKDIYDVYMLQRAKKGARIEKSRQAYLIPLRDLIANSPWSAKEVGDMLAARHIKNDKVNIDLAERASYGYTKELLKSLSDAKRKELMKARVNVKAGKMPDGSAYTDANGNAADMAASTKRKLMFDLMNQYVQFEEVNPNGQQELRMEWENFKDASGGFSNGGVAKGTVRTVDEVLALADKDKAKFDQIANLFDAMNRHTLDVLEEGGLITADEHARLLTSKSAYAPLRRESYNVNREIELLFERSGQGGSKQVATRTGTASLSEPTLVLQNALAKVETAAAAAERNLANKELYEVVVNDREGWKPWFTIVDKDPYVTHDEDGFLQEKRSTASNRADIVLIHNGKKIIVRPNMHNERAMGFVRAVNNLDAQMLNGPMKVLNWVNSLVRWVNVSASPVFLMSNLIRDPFTAAYNLQATEAAPYTKEIFLNWMRSFKALKKVYIDGNRDLTDADVLMLEKFEKAGGRTSFIQSLKEMDDNDWGSFEGQVARRQGSIKYLMAVKDKWLDGIENYNILFENIMRFSSFMTLMEKGGISETRAARISQDITTNFSRRGYKSQMLGVWWLFFNASVQGNYQVLRNLMGSRRVQAAVGGTIVAALILDLLGRAIADDWDKIPEWDKERYIILPIKVAGDFVKIPAPWVYNIVWRMGGMMGETLSGVRKPQSVALDVAAMAMTSLNPLGKPGSLAQAITPTAADPFVQILENKDFSGNPIGPEGYPGASKKANSELLWSTTPKGYQSFARFVNEATGGSAAESGKIDLRPGDYQILAKFLTGSLGRFLSDSTYGIKEGIDKGIEGPKDIPVIREFFSDPYNPMMVQKYHTNIASVYGAHRLEQMYVKGPDRDLIKLQDVRKERSEELRMYSQAQDVERQLKSLRIRLRAAQSRGDIAREKELKDKINKVQEQFNLAYEQKVG